MLKPRTGGYRWVNIYINLVALTAILIGSGMLVGLYSGSRFLPYLKFDDFSFLGWGFILSGTAFIAILRLQFNLCRLCSALVLIAATFVLFEYLFNQQGSGLPLAAILLMLLALAQLSICHFDCTSNTLRLTLYVSGLLISFISMTPLVLYCCGYDLLGVHISVYATTVFMLLGVAVLVFLIDVMQIAWDDIKVPFHVLALVLFICILPLLLNLMGFDFSSYNKSFTLDQVVSNGVAYEEMVYLLRGAGHHALLEWIGIVISIVTLIVAFTYHFYSRDVSLLIIGLTLMVPAVLDMFHIVTAMSLTEGNFSSANLIPLTWALTRTLGALVMIAGVVIVLNLHRANKYINTRQLIVICSIFSVFAALLMNFVVGSSNLPQTEYPKLLITRPYDVLPLFLFLCAAPIFAYWYRLSPGPLSMALFMSLIAGIAMEMHMAFGSSRLFDNHFNIAHILKNLMYFILLAGFLFEGIRVCKLKLSVSENMLNVVVENVPSGIITIDSRGIIQSYNQAAENMFGYSELETVGKNIKMLMPEPYRSEHDGYLANYLCTGKAKVIGLGRMQVQGQKNDGAVFPVDLGVREVQHEGKKIFVGVVNDITEKVAFEQELQSMIEKLTASNEELERFAFVASHDLQEPIRMIISFTQLLSRDYRASMDENGHRYMDIVTQSAERMHGLINDLLEYSRVGNQVERYEITDCNKIFNVVCENLGDSIGQSHATVSCDELPVLTVNPLRLTQILQNLISNALKYQKPDVFPKIHISCGQQGSAWEFSVKDNGIGIKSEYCGKIFEPFKRLHSAQLYSGTGIGLAICNKIVTCFGGSMRVESELDKGSIFYFTIPQDMERRVA